MLGLFQGTSHISAITPHNDLAGDSLPLTQRLRLSAVFCALAVLLSALISRPYAEMGICDDGPYVFMAHTLATTGHIVYSGWGAPMIGWQLYLGAAFIKLFGFSFTAVRCSTVLVAMALAFMLQRTFVRSGIPESNATIGTLALVLSPLYLTLAVTYMSDIFGLFAIVICLYGCLRALQASTERSAILWLCFAVASNAICGTARQIAWLGVLVMVPSTLWLLRSRRRVLIAGAAATLVGALFIFACMQWLKYQPFFIPEHIFSSKFSVTHALGVVRYSLLNIPFLLFPMLALFVLEIRRKRQQSIVLLLMVFFCFLFLALYPSHIRGIFNVVLEPTMGDFVNPHGIVYEAGLRGEPPIFLPRSIRAVITIISLCGLGGVAALLFRSRRRSVATNSGLEISWKQLGVLLAPFTFAYALFLLPRAGITEISDRYLLPGLIGLLICLVRCYQERINTSLPVVSWILVGIAAMYSVTANHHSFSFYRARVALAAELQAAGIPDTSVDNGWEYNFGVELKHAGYLNESTIKIPAGAYTPVPPPSGICPMVLYEDTPHIHPLYGISFEPDACEGPAPFAPVHYSRWPYRTPGTLYVVRYTQTGLR